MKKSNLAIIEEGGLNLKGEFSFKDAPEISFMSPNNKEAIRIKKGKFYWKGQEVKDKYKVYERFNEWLKQTEIN